MGGRKSSTQKNLVEIQTHDPADALPFFNFSVQFRPSILSQNSGYKLGARQYVTWFRKQPDQKPVDPDIVATHNRLTYKAQLWSPV